MASNLQQQPLKWSASEVRKTFVDYFVQRQHSPIVSSSTIPYNDTTLMFANSGMNQFKSIFQGVTYIYLFHSIDG